VEVSLARLCPDKFVCSPLIHAFGLLDRVSDPVVAGTLLTAVVGDRGGHVLQSISVGIALSSGEVQLTLCRLVGVGIHRRLCSIHVSGHQFSLRYREYPSTLVRLRAWGSEAVEERHPADIFRSSRS
jgi:hypothetical protein